jgi:hypothetical protein
VEKQVPLRLSEEEYEWLRKHSFETKLSMAEICRRGLALYREALEKKEQKEQK